MRSEKVVVELCRSNSIGSHYAEPAVIEWREVDPEEAASLLGRKMAPGYWWRLQPADATGNAWVDAPRKGE
jgi:hypothetical protein